MEAIVFIYIKVNNIFLSLTTIQGNILTSWSAGQSGFQNSRKSTPYAAQSVVTDFLKTIEKYNVKQIHIKVFGFGPGREAALRRLLQGNFQILTFVDRTPYIYNGCRPPKTRKL